MVRAGKIGRRSRRNVDSRSKDQIRATNYSDFVIIGRRRDRRFVEMSVYASPAGASPAPEVVLFPRSEAARIHDLFYSNLRSNDQGWLKFNQAKATRLGKRLTAVLLPTRIFQLLVQSLAQVARTPDCALRIRLAMDASLTDLPWEYVYRPDHMDSNGLSGFLLLDPKISMLRESPNPRVAIEPIARHEDLNFVGTLWEGQVDGWEVRTEFNLLRDALKPISNYILPTFSIASDKVAFRRGAAILHYAGHCDSDPDGRSYLIRELPRSGRLEQTDKIYIDELAASLRKSRVRLVVLSACNSGFWPIVEPLLEAGVPAVIGVNGAIASQSTIEFCAKLYESLCLGLTLDEAVSRARVRIMQWDQESGLFDWGLYMVYMPSPQAVLFPRAETPGLRMAQSDVRRDHSAIVESSLQAARELDKLDFGEIMSELTQRRVLILGRFTGRRLEVLNAIKKHLDEHPNRYIGELFTFPRPDLRDLIENIVAFAGLSRFIVSDLSEPRSVQSELEAIVTRFRSVPVVPLINYSGKEYATFSSVQRSASVVKPTIRYRNVDDLLKKLNEIVLRAEAKLEEVRPPA
jgi:hypothetical protein